MTKIVLLDAGPLGMVSHPRPDQVILAWLGRLLTADVEVLVPEIADYEVRRELLRAGKSRSIRRLNELHSTLGFLAITTDAMRKAAEFWADARRLGRPTAHEMNLDADAILAGQAATFSVGKVVIATSNPRHLSRFVPAENWHEIGP